MWLVFLKNFWKKLVNDFGEATESSSAAPSKEHEDIIEDIPNNERAAAGTSVDNTDSVIEQQLTECIEGLQQAFGIRIERIIDSNRGLLVILDQVGSQENQIAADLSKKIQVAVIDQRTLSGLERLGAAPSLAESQTYYDASEQVVEEQAVPRLVQIAAEKLKAATVLMEQQIFSGAVELLVSALLSAAAGRAGLETPVTVQDAGVWIYGEALTKGIVNQDEAALIMRAVSLGQAQAVPEALLTDLRLDVEDFVQS